MFVVRCSTVSFYVEISKLTHIAPGLYVCKRYSFNQRTKQVEIACQDTNGVDCQDIPQPEPDSPEDCDVDVVYEYCVSNSGGVPQRVTKLERTRDETTTDLTGQLQTTLLQPGDDECVVETETIDVCQGTKFMTTATVESTTIGSSPKLCEDNDMYMFTPEVPCKTEVDITCVDSEGNECKLTPEPLTPEDCIEPFTYTYTVENVGPTCMTLNTWTATCITENVQMASQLLLSSIFFRRSSRGERKFVLVKPSLSEKTVDDGLVLR